MILDAMRQMKRPVGDHTALYGLICGPMTLASHLRGTEIFMDMFDHPDYLNALLAYSRDVALRMAELYLEAGMDVIAVVDPLVSQVSPRHFKQFLLEPFTPVFDAIRQRAPSPPSLCAATPPRTSRSCARPGPIRSRWTRTSTCPQPKRSPTATTSPLAATSP